MENNFEKWFDSSGYVEIDPRIELLEGLLGVVKPDWNGHAIKLWAETKILEIGEEL